MRPHDRGDFIVHHVIVDQALPLRHLDATLQVNDVHGEPDGSHGVVTTSVHRLPDPKHRVGREAGALLRVELLCRADETAEPFLDQIVELLTASRPALCRANAESKVREHESLDRSTRVIITLFRRLVRSCANPPTEIVLLLRSKQPASNVEDADTGRQAAGILRHVEIIEDGPREVPPEPDMGQFWRWWSAPQLSIFVEHAAPEIQRFP
jgi:hypothetical protein